MTLYTAMFRTAGAYAEHDFDADSPEQALRMARAFFDAHADDLIFEAYADHLPLDEIEVADPEGDTLAIWHSEELRLRLAAPVMLTALQMAANFMADDLSGDPTETRVYKKLRAVIAKATGT